MLRFVCLFAAIEQVQREKKTNRNLDTSRACLVGRFAWATGIKNHSISLHRCHNRAMSSTLLFRFVQRGRNQSKSSSQLIEHSIQDGKPKLRYRRSSHCRSRFSWVRHSLRIQTGPDELASTSCTNLVDCLIASQRDATAIESLSP